MAETLASKKKTTLLTTNKGMECLAKYKIGGFHPVHFGDHIVERYRILSKLGAGAFGTVWLCKDTIDHRYVALKVCKASKPDEAEVPMEIDVAQLDQLMPGAQYFAAPLDYFNITGPNGTHRCIVSPVLGPTVAPDLWKFIPKDSRAATLRKLARQTVEAMIFLHKNGIFHGDFRPSNILVKLKNFDHLSEEELLNRLGHDECEKTTAVTAKTGVAPSASQPRYLAHAIDIQRLGQEYLMDEICVIDFGQSGKRGDRKKVFLCLPVPYLSPEYLLYLSERERRGQKPSKQCLTTGSRIDEWSLACTIAEIIMQQKLFHQVWEPDLILSDMVNFFGKLPPFWWENWKPRAERFDANGKYRIYTVDDRVRQKLKMSVGEKQDSGNSLYTLESFLEGYNHPRKIERPSEEEQKLLADLLKRMCRYVPSARLSLDKVLEHKWFKL